MPAALQTRKPRPKPAPYQPKPREKDSGQTSAAATSAKSIKTKTCRENLTLNDWFTVFEFIDSHPNVPQERIVEHFKTLQEDALEFTQSTLSRKLKMRAELQERVNSHPNALSGKRPRAVTSPEVEKALVLWVRCMEEKGETVNGKMLCEKRGRFEKEFNIPEESRLTGDGWVAPFCKAYKIKEYRRHGEAGSVDMDAVAAEQARLQKILSTFPRKDRFNFDETSFFAFAPPDWGLATKQMSGKKKEKFRITLGLAANADGSEKLPLFYIGRSQRPKCFGSRPEKSGFYYRSNKKAWMTMELFEEWVKLLDLKMGAQKRFICLLVDNFAGHLIAYTPRHIQIEFFKPNLTSFVQPLDAGVIRCFKALYRRAFCKRAIDLDEINQCNIFKINLHEAMLMAKEAWEQVTPETIEHCWDHTRIQADSYNPSQAPTSHPTHSNPHAWSILRDFATNDNMTLPLAESRLQQLLGDSYIDDHWRAALTAVMNAEGDTEKASAAVEKLAVAATHRTGLVIKIPALRQPPQLAGAEEELLESVKILKDRNRIFGTPMTMDELLAAKEETEIGEERYQLGDDEAAIVAEVQHQMAVERGDIVEIESDDEDTEPRAAAIPRSEIMQMCEKLEMACLSESDANTSLELTRLLRKFRGELRWKELLNAKQTTLDGFWKS